MGLRFSKMHGAGNDFVVLDARHAPMPLDAAQIRAMADRHTGVGFDQLLSIEPARDGASAWRYGIWNADGSPSGQCGNGVRCVAAWLHRAGLLDTAQLMQVESPSGAVHVRLIDAGSVAVDMGAPRFTPVAIPFDAGSEQDDYAIDVAGTMLTIGAVSMGNPHAVVEVESFDDPHLATRGPALSAHPRFPDGCNAGFALRRSSGEIDLKVHERGSGWTLACGTGACAAVAVLARRGRVGPRVTVQLPGGRLQIDWAGPGHTLWMTGPAAFVFEGEWAC
ncbi:MAG TPA: diaminopimelate epimerase [Rhodanobacteraceae bacterium]|nr:diaminopimelate epimerase [Rhodanobacteraceae bacterium]